MKKELDEKQLEYVNGGNIEIDDLGLIAYYDGKTRRYCAVLDKEKATELINEMSGTSDKNIVANLRSAGCLGRPRFSAVEALKDL